MKTVRDRYPEMGDGDSDLETVVTDLGRMGQLCRSSTLSAQHEARVVHALRERAAERARHHTGHHTSNWLPRYLFAQHRSLALIAVAVVTLGALVGGAYATVTTLSRVFDMGAANNVITQNLGTRVNQSQTVAGYTMTVERAYADSNRVILAYTIRPPATGKRQWNLTPDNLKVVTASGVELPDRGHVVASDTGQPDATLQMFDAEGITDTPKEVHLRLTVPWIDGMEKLDPLPGENSQELPTTGSYGSIATNRSASLQIAASDPYVHDFRVFGPLTFDITVPFDRGREVSPHQQINAGGVTLTLERIMVSPTETRVYVRGLDPNQSHYVQGILSGDAWTDEDVDGGSRSVWYSNGMTVFSYLGSFTDKHGAWSLTLKPLPGAAGSAPAGPWSFHFTAP